MATGDWSKAEAKATAEAVEEIFKALPKTKQRLYFGHLNDILCFLGKAEMHAPEEENND